MSARESAWGEKSSAPHCTIGINRGFALSLEHGMYRVLLGMMILFSYHLSICRTHFSSQDYRVHISFCVGRAINCPLPWIQADWRWRTISPQWDHMYVMSFKKKNRGLGGGVAYSRSGLPHLHAWTLYVSLYELWAYLVGSCRYFLRAYFRLHSCLY